MDRQQLERLKELAEKATPGEWECRHSDTLVVSKNGRLITSATHCSFNRKFALVDCADANDNAAYIAAANPQAILELIAENKRLEKDRARLEIELHDMDSGNREAIQDFRQLEKEADWLAAQLAHLDMRFQISGEKTDASYWRREARKAVEEQCRT